MPAFQIVPLAPSHFDALFALDDAELRRRGILRRIADTSPGFPCRVSLVDAAIGDELLLLPFEHQPAASPYRASGPIFVKRGAQPAQLAPDEVPPYVSIRLISVRAYDAADLIIDAAVVEGAEVDARIRAMLANPAVAYLHLHNAKRGCFSCKVVRA